MQLAVDDQVDPRDVVDGDGITAYVDTATPEESADVPMEVQQAAIQRTAARAARNYREADALKKNISAAGYGSNELSPSTQIFVCICQIHLIFGLLTDSRLAQTGMRSSHGSIESG